MNKSHVTHLESALDGTHLPADRIQTLHNSRPLWVRYDIDAVAQSVSKTDLPGRASTMWRYRELLPPSPDDELVSLGEGMTPLLRCPTLGAQFGVDNLYMKDESQLPTGSFKSRGLAMAVTMARKFGVTRVAIPTAGNAGGAAAAYAARAGMEAWVFMPEDTPRINQLECLHYGAKTFLVNGLIGDCARLVREGSKTLGWFDLSTLKEPYRIEGKKTMGLELAEQFDWKLPDVILYPTGGGTGLIGMWKAFNELRTIDWLNSDNMPKMVAVQSDGCGPIVRAYERGDRFAEPFEHAATIASGIRVPSAIGDFMILDAIRESNGCAVAVEELRIKHWMRLVASCEGIAICPETATCIGALKQLTRSGWILRDQRVVIFNTGAAQKYVEAIDASPPRLDISKPIDWDQLAAD
ncbi:MAG: threonine synthase [Candidatus Zixiibacteriota bacterium]